MLIGRAGELRAIADGLDQSRLVTLVGPGGVGKTTLASAVAADRPDDAVLVADLAPLDADDLAEGIAGGAGFSSFAALLEAIETRETLLVLDNCEHVIDVAAAVVSRILDSTIDVTVLATSRTRLDVPPELTIPIDPLSTDGSPSPAVELFVAKARARGITLRDGAGLDELCRRLDGLPLALELAAARASGMTVAEMINELGTRLDLLTRTRARGPARHHSLGAAIAWSFHLLEPNERDDFALLATFPAPFTAEMAARLIGTDPVAARLRLLSFVDRSLLVHQADGPVSWYRLLDTIRTYASERLEASGATAGARRTLLDLVAELFDDLALRARACTFGVAPELGRLYRHAHWAIDAAIALDDPGPATRIASTFWWLEDVGHQSEAADVIERMLRRWPDHPDHGVWLGVAAAMHRKASRHERGREVALRAVEHGGRGAAYGHRALGQDARLQGEWDDAFAHFAAGAAAARSAGYEGLALEIELHAALTRARAGDMEGAFADLEALIAAGQEYPLVRAWAADFLAYTSLAHDPQRSKAIARDLVDVGLEHDEWLVASSYVNLGLVALLDDDPQQAAGHIAAAIESFLAIHSRNDITLAFLAAAACFVRLGDERSARAVLATERRYTNGVLGGFEAELLARVGPLPDSPGDSWLEPTEMIARLERAASEPPLAAGTVRAPNRFVRNGDSWLVTYEGVEIRLADRKGLADLALLLAQPGQEIAALDLMGASVVAGDAGPASDEKARRQYAERVRSLQQTIDDATAMGDLGRAEAAQLEMDELVDHLSAMYGLGGRQRTEGQPAEKARSAVTWRIRAAIRAIGEQHAELGAHLDRSVRTGRFCVYDPLPPVTWAE